MVVYTIQEYIQSCESLDSKIKSIEALITAMMDQAFDAIGNTGTASYSMDDGQMKVTTNYRTMSEITQGIKDLEKLLQLYINRRNGSITVLRGRLNY